jgi:hypothetical protein
MSKNRRNSASIIASLLEIFLLRVVRRITTFREVDN